MTNYQIREKANALIRKAVKEHKSKGFHNWEKLGQDFESLKRDAISEVGIDDYSAYCKRVEEIGNIVEGKYDKYFKVGTMYNHINGNEKFKKLLI